MAMPRKEKEVAIQIWKLQIKLNRLNKKNKKDLNDFFNMRKMEVKLHLLKLERKKVREEVYFNSKKRGIKPKQ
jgi:hypothetical protein